MQYTYKETVSGSPKYSVWDSNNHLAGYTNTKGFIEYDESCHLLDSPRQIDKHASQQQQLKASEIF